MKHALLFIDHAQAKLFHVDDTDPKGATLKPTQHHTRKTKHKEDGKAQHGDKHFLDEVMGLLKGNDEIIVVEPGQAKNELMHHLGTHGKDVKKHVVAVETVDHPTDNQLVALAKQRFKAIDQWL
jgi:stalled ribosome rescue protein Dom34